MGQALQVIKLNDIYKYRWALVLVLSSLLLNWLGVSYFQWVSISSTVPTIGLEQTFHPPFVLIVVTNVLEITAMPILVAWALKADQGRVRLVDRVWITFSIINIAIIGIAAYLASRPTNRIVQIVW